MTHGFEVMPAVTVVINIVLLLFVLIGFRLAIRQKND